MTHEIIADTQDIADDVRFGTGVRIEAQEVFIGPGAVIGDDVTIEAREVHIGWKTRIEERCIFTAIGGPAERIHLGDYGYVGFDTRVLVPELSTGDYTAIHNHVLVNGYRPCRLGHNGFIGQHSVLNSAADLTIGNNFRMALNGYVWTHAESGELLEGCNFYHRTPTVIEDNVWLTGCNITVSPGLRLGNGSIVLMGSVVTKDTLPRHCYSGVPAKDITDKTKPYRDVSHEEKIDMMKGFVREFVESNESVEERDIAFSSDAEHAGRCTGAKILILENGPAGQVDDGASVFSLADKTYIKQRSEIEERFMRFLVGARARFLPCDP